MPIMFNMEQMAMFRSIARSMQSIATSLEEINRKLPAEAVEEKQETKTETQE